MRLIRDIESMPLSARGAAIAIGNFDGLHQGHRAVIARMLEAAREKGATPSVLTFEPHPRMFFRKSTAPLRVEPFHIKIKRMEQMGVEQVFVLRFTKSFSELSAEAFAEGILHHKLQASHITTGENFIFGHGRKGDTAYLETLAERGLFGFAAVPPLMLDGEPCSSSRIRDALSQGDIPLANRLLGREYEVFGRIQRGDGRGRTIGFPTMNIRLQHLFPPKSGVYGVEVAVESSLTDSATTWLPGVANWGTRPTFDGTGHVFEIHLLQGDAFDYGERIRVRLKGFIREEQKFSGVEALTRQIDLDVATARKMLHC